MKQSIKKHLINSRGKTITDKIIVIESDDWGSIRIPNRNVQIQLAQERLIRLEEPFSAKDCLESEEDITALFDVLSKFKDKNGRHPVFTANMVMGNPDFARIEATDFKDFFWEPFYKAYASYYPKQATFDTLKKGIAQGFIYPQFHAREHLNALQWLDRLKSGDNQFLTAFKFNCFAIDDQNVSNQRANLMATYDYKSPFELEFIESGIEEGLTFFKETFGFESSTTIAPCYVWNDHIERIFFNHSVRSLQSSYMQQFNDPSKSTYKPILKKSGALSKFGQRISVRNVLFEPALDSSVDWVNKAMESISIAFLWRKPAVIGTHRINFVAGLSDTNRANSLKQLEQLLAAILKKWPNVIFMNSAELNEYYNRG